MGTTARAKSDGLDQMLYGGVGLAIGSAVDFASIALGVIVQLVSSVVLVYGIHLFRADYRTKAGRTGGPPVAQPDP